MGPNNSSGSSNEIYEAINPDLTAAQVTVCSINNRLIYNLEYKVNNYNNNNNNKEDLNINYQQQQQLKSQSKQNIESIANVVTAKFYNHSRNHSRRHSRQTSSNSENLLTIDQLSSDSIWDDWILKYISNNKQISEDMVFTKNSDNLSNIISDDDTIINNGNNNNEDESIEHWT
ncbi:8407_t:CDS:2 [Entrophospora sp. SA101]|nr:18882_t:CDS:2 [Entrophospora sp. SA101]CAJ0859638.1 8407_t:CDS:2 [Entrophospora sp. SA101]